MQLLPECRLVASGRLGFSLSSDWDSHAYLVHSGSEAVLIDAGSGRDVVGTGDRIAESLEGRELVAIVLTHGHVDHSGGAAALSARFDVPVHAHPIARDWLMTGDEEAVGLPQARSAGMYPPDQVLEPVPCVLAVGDSITVGDRELSAHYTPGHSLDHIVYTIELEAGLAMFSGDLIFAQGRVAILDTLDTDVARYEESIRAMSRLAPDMLFPGHGAVALARGSAHLAAAVAAYDRGDQPGGFIA